MTDLVDMMERVPTAAELAVRRLRQQLEQLANHGQQWSPEAMAISRRLEYARAQVLAEESE